MGFEVNVEVLDFVVDVKRVVCYEVLVMFVIFVCLDGFVVNSCEYDLEWKIEVLVELIVNEVNFLYFFDYYL